VRGPTGGQTWRRQGAFPWQTPVICRSEALAVKRGEEPFDQADKFILEFGRTEER
jgi:hypothetical protein